MASADVLPPKRLAAGLGDGVGDGERCPAVSATTSAPNKNAEYRLSFGSGATSGGGDRTGSGATGATLIVIGAFVGATAGAGALSTGV
jgi:hypothetical protein